MEEKRDPYKNKERWLEWRATVKNHIPEVSKANSELILNYLDDKDRIMKECDILLTELIKYEVLFYSSETPKNHLMKDLKAEKLNKIYLENFGNLFDYMFNNEKNYSHPESLKHRMIVRSQFAKVLHLLNQEIKISKIFYQGFGK